MRNPKRRPKKIIKNYSGDPELMFRNSFNTRLNKRQNVEFQNWITSENQKQGRDLSMDLGAYDLKGYWKDNIRKGINPNDEDNHGPDIYKKPNHPTFSTESKYSSKRFPGGVWNEDSSYDPPEYLKKHYSKEYYNDLFGNEPHRPEKLGKYSKGGFIPTQDYFNLPWPAAYQLHSGIDKSVQDPSYIQNFVEQGFDKELTPLQRSQLIRSAVTAQPAKQTKFDADPVNFTDNMLLFSTDKIVSDSLDKYMEDPSGMLKYMNRTVKGTPMYFNGGPLEEDKVRYNSPEYRKAYTEGNVTTYSPTEDIYTAPMSQETVITAKDPRIKNAVRQGQEQFLSDVASVVTLPQRQMMLGLTGKEQLPSEAWGYNDPTPWSWRNPWVIRKDASDFLMNMVLDPVNIIPGAGLFRAAKNPASTVRLRNVQRAFKAGKDAPLSGLHKVTPRIGETIGQMEARLAHKVKTPPGGSLQSLADHHKFLKEGEEQARNYFLNQKDAITRNIELSERINFPLSNTPSINDFLKSYRDPHLADKLHIGRLRLFDKPVTLLDDTALNYGVWNSIQRGGPSRKAFHRYLTPNNYTWDDYDQLRHGIGIGRVKGIRNVAPEASIHENLHRVFHNTPKILDDVILPSNKMLPIEAEKIKRVFKSPTELEKHSRKIKHPGYLGSDDELIVHTLHRGAGLGISNKAPYIGYERFKSLLNEAAQFDDFYNLYKLDNKRDYKRLWDVMSGKSLAFGGFITEDPVENPLVTAESFNVNFTQPQEYAVQPFNSEDINTPQKQLSQYPTNIIDKKEYIKPLQAERNTIDYALNLPDPDTAMRIVQKASEVLNNPRVSVEPEKLVDKYIEAEEKRLKENVEKYYLKYQPSNKEEVIKLQTMLRDSGYKDLLGNYGPNKDGVDGMFGPKTRAAYEEYVGELFGRPDYSTLNDKDRHDRKGCAAFVNDATGLTSGDAWTMFNYIENQGGQVKYNAYSDPKFKNVSNIGQVKGISAELAKNRPNFKNTLKVGDVVGIFNPSSSFNNQAFSEGKGTYNSHVGLVTDIDDNGNPVITHNVNHDLRRNTYDQVRVMWIATPKGTTMAKLNESDKPDSKELPDLLNYYTDKLPKALNINISSETLQKDIYGILKLESNLGELQPSDKTIDRNRAIKRFAIPLTKGNFSDVLKPVERSEMSIGPGKIKMNNFSRQERSFLGLKSTDDLKDMGNAVKTATYLYLRNYNIIDKYAKNNPHLQIMPEDVRLMTILAHNEGVGKFIQLGYKSDVRTFHEELESMRNLAKVDSVFDVTSTKFRFIPNQYLKEKAYELKYGKEGHTPYIKRVLQHGEVMSFKNGGYLKNKDMNKRVGKNLKKTREEMFDPTYMLGSNGEMLPQYGFGDWLKRNAGNLLTTVGGAIMTPFNPVAGIGMITSGVAGVAGTEVANSAQNDAVAQAEQQSKRQMLESQIQPQQSYAWSAYGGKLNKMKKYQQGGIIDYQNGQTHEGPDEGIPVDEQGNPTAKTGGNPIGLTEKGEVVWLTPQNESYVFSNRLKLPGNKKRTFAQEARTVSNKFKLYLGKDFDKSDKLSKEAMDAQLAELMMIQESLKGNTMRTDEAQTMMQQQMQQMQGMQQQMPQEQMMSPEEEMMMQQQQGGMDMMGGGMDMGMGMMPQEMPMEEFARGGRLPKYQEPLKGRSNYIDRSVADPWNYFPYEFGRFNSSGSSATSVPNLTTAPGIRLNRPSFGSDFSVPGVPRIAKYASEPIGNSTTTPATTPVAAPPSGNFQFKRYGEGEGEHNFLGPGGHSGIPLGPISFGPGKDFGIPPGSTSSNEDSPWSPYVHPLGAIIPAASTALQLALNKKRAKFPRRYLSLPTESREAERGLVKDIYGEQRNTMRRAYANTGVSSGATLAGITAGETGINTNLARGLSDSYSREHEMNRGIREREILANAEVDRYADMMDNQEDMRHRMQQQALISNFGNIGAGYAKDLTDSQRYGAYLNMISDNYELLEGNKGKRFFRGSRPYLRAKSTDRSITPNYGTTSDK